MKNVIFSLALGAGALMASGAIAAPLAVQPSLATENAVEQVRLVCDDSGRCYRTRGGRRVIVERSYGNSYNYDRRGYRERRHYGGGGYNQGPSVGIGVGPGGVGVGVGVGPRW